MKRTQRRICQKQRLQSSRRRKSLRNLGTLKSLRASAKKRSVCSYAGSWGTALGRGQSLWRRRKRWLCAQTVRAATIPLVRRRRRSSDLRKRRRANPSGRRRRRRMTMMMIQRSLNHLLSSWKTGAWKTLTTCSQRRIIEPSPTTRPSASLSDPSLLQKIPRLLSPR
uniref:Uncharacterized protein n=1 Tax=Colobus angolensis palliatus TaxID=336983 RepID=A0A2K5JAQ3_COLAP